MDIKNQIDVLNDLLSKAYDAEKGYEEAAGQVEDAKLKIQLKGLATNRYNFGHEIKSQLNLLGGEVEKGDTIAAKAHRVWMELRNAFSANNEAAVLAEVIRGEENTLKNYEEALKALDGYEASYNMIARQRSRVAETLGKIKLMEKTYASV